MPQGPFSRIVIRRPDGTADVIGRVGFCDPQKTARLLFEGGHGEVVAVRHEMMPLTGKPGTVAIHGLKR